MYFVNETDLLLEIVKNKCLETGKQINVNNLDTVKQSDFVIERYEITTNKEAQNLGRPKGKYILVSIPDMMKVDKSRSNKFVKRISEELSMLLGNITRDDTILIVGLGNEDIESDSLGRLTAEKVILTRLLTDNERGEMCKVCSISPSVMGMTGIDTADIVSAIVKTIKPKIVLVVDSLCASSHHRLGKSLQITNVGIVPGGGVNNPKKAINKDLLGCPVITIGIPLMIYAKSIAKDLEDIDREQILTLHNIGNFVDTASDIIARIINKSILGIETL